MDSFGCNQFLNTTRCHEYCISDFCYVEYTCLLDNNNSSYLNATSCLSYTEKLESIGKLEKHLDAPIPWIGMYIAAASAICSVAMAADAFNGFRSKKLWGPCKYFSLNAFSLTLLAVSMKLTVDLTSSKMGASSKIASVSSLALMSTAMSNFMTSVASMDNHEILVNLTALGFLAFTVAVDTCIQFAQTIGVLEIDGGNVLVEEIVGVVFLLLLLVLQASSSLAILTASKYIESKYREMHNKIASNKWGQEGNPTTVDELRVYVKKYWVMAETGSPQFVMARSAISGTSGLMCLLMALTLLEAHVRIRVLYPYTSESEYKWSVNWVLTIQSTGVVLGTIAPLMRWFVAARLKTSETGRKSSTFRDEFKIEPYWTLRLVEWRESSLPLQIRHHKLRKLLHGAKSSALNICIGVQTLIVLISKLVILVPATIVSVIFPSSLHLMEPSAAASTDMDDYSNYVLLLEGETKIPKNTLTNIYNEFDELIQRSRRNQSNSLVNLLKKSRNFYGVIDFESNEIQSLNSQLELPNCWSLPVVTLTSIAISLPNITAQKSKQLFTAVSEGLYFVKLIQKTLDLNGELESIIKAADVVWAGLEFYKKWQDNDLQAAGLKTHTETLQKLSDIAKNVVTKDFLVQNPLNWPAKVISANSMYRITQTILLSHKYDHHQTDEEVFEKLSVMISDILAACLTNLERVIVFKCHRNAIQDREKNIRQATLLLGESGEIIEILQQREIPEVNPERAASIQGWRAFLMEQDHGNPAGSVSATFPQAHGEHVSIGLQE